MVSRSMSRLINKRGYFEIVLGAINLVYLGLWAAYVIVAFIWYSYGLAPFGYLVGWFRSNFDILGFNWETVPPNDFGALIISRNWTLLDWFWRTIRRDFVSLSMLSSIVYLIEKWRRKQKPEDA